MVERDLLNLVKSSEEEAEDIIKRAKEEVDRMKASLDNEKKKIIEQLTVQLNEKKREISEELSKSLESNRVLMEKEYIEAAEVLRKAAYSKLNAYAEELLKKLIEES